MWGCMTESEPRKDKILDIFEPDRDIEEQHFIYSLLNLEVPLQFEIFWIESPLECQYLCITHDDNREHGELIVNGPYRGQEFIEELRGVLEKPRWQQPVDEDPISRFDSATGTSMDISIRRDAILSSLQGIEIQCGGEVFRGDGTRLVSARPLDGENWIVFIRGNLFEADSFNSLFPEAPSEDEESEAEADEESEAEDREEAESEHLFAEDEPDALGTYIYEPVWVGGTPELNFRRRILVKPPRDYETVYSTEIDSYKVLISKDGFIAVDQPNDSSAVLEVLNTIFGASVLLGKPLQAATQNDLMDVAVTDDEIVDRRGDPSLPRVHAEPEPMASLSWSGMRDPLVERDTISTEYIDEVMSTSIDIFEREELRNRLNSTLQAYTHHVNGEYTQSFLLAWISIEQYINNELDEYLKEDMSVNSERRRNMQRGGHWSASHLIELMEVSGCISNSRYSKITSMRKRRNEIVHETDSATEEESEEIVNLSFSLIYEGISGDDKPPDYV